MSGYGLHHFTLKHVRLIFFVSMRRDLIKTELPHNLKTSKTEINSFLLL